MRNLKINEGTGILKTDGKCSDKSCSTFRVETLLDGSYSPFEYLSEGLGKQGKVECL